MHDTISYAQLPFLALSAVSALVARYHARRAIRAARWAQPAPDVREDVRAAVVAAHTAAARLAEPQLSDAGQEACRNCGALVEPDPAASPYPWRHAGAGASCWIGPDGTRNAAFFGDFAEPRRRCAECGEPETEAEPLFGTEVFSGPVRYYCRDVRDCVDRRTTRLAELARRPPCPDGSGHAAETCPGTWHFPVVGAE
jgi:hypothetical protein